MVRSAAWLLIVTAILDGYSLMITDDSQNSPNFPPAKYSNYMVEQNICSTAACFV